jgi:hypothetical protein
MVMGLQVFDRKGIQDTPSFAREPGEVGQYWRGVLEPALASIPAVGDVIAFINIQIAQWDLIGDGEAPWPPTIRRTMPERDAADLIVSLLQDILALCFLRETARLAAVEGELAHA